MNLIYLKCSSKSQQMSTLFQRYFNLNNCYDNFMLKLVNKWTFCFSCLCYPTNAASGPACLSMFDEKRSNVLLYNYFMSRTGFILFFFQHRLLPWSLLDWFFPGLTPGFSLGTQPQDPAGSSALCHHSLFLPFVITCLKPARSLGGCSVFTMSLLPSHRWSHMRLKSLILNTQSRCCRMSHIQKWGHRETAEGVLPDIPHLLENSTCGKSLNTSALNVSQVLFPPMIGALLSHLFWEHVTLEQRLQAPALHGVSPLVAWLESRNALHRADTKALLSKGSETQMQPLSSPPPPTV